MRRALVFVVLAGLPIVWAEAAPQLVVERKTSQAELTALPSVFDEPEISKRLESGLTNTFVVRATPPRGTAELLALIEVRYELWDEAYLVSLEAARELREERAFPSRSELVSWWKSLRLPLGGEGVAAGESVELELVFVPFSRSEQRAARAWLSESISANRTPSRREQPDAGPFARAVDVAVATSITRDSVWSRRWVLTAEEGRDAQR